MAELSENSSGYGGMKQVFTISLALFIIFLDGSIVNIALPSIIKEYSTDLGMASWIINAYVITVAVFLVFMGKIGDMLGRAKFYNIGLVMFMLSSFFARFPLMWRCLSFFVFFKGLAERL
ncbi:MFS transporter [Peribacillus frigoritolerans]|nr:MFS transporter [Peribacillus frigoritolerans]